MKTARSAANTWHEHSPIQMRHYTSNKLIEPLHQGGRKCARTSVARRKQSFAAGNFGSPQKNELCISQHHYIYIQ